MSWFDRFVVWSLPAVPRSVVARVASRYVAGSDIDAAIGAVKTLNGLGAMGTVDILGEEVTQAERAEWAVDEYLRFLDAIAADSLDANISIKLTLLGLRVDEKLCRDNVARIAGPAKDRGLTVRMDMEDHTCTDATLRIYRSLQPRFGNIGIVLQAMLKRTPDDIAALAPDKPSVRLCKGIYLESEEVALRDRDAIRQAYLAQLRALVTAGCYVGIATHDDPLIDAARELATERRLPPDRYEFQMLLGVRPKLRAELIAQGHRMRVYVPYGADWYGYSVRRLRENPTVASHVMRAFFRAG